MKTLICLLTLFSLINACLAGEIFDYNQSFVVEPKPHTIAIGDLNNDGRNDIAVLHCNRIRPDEAVMIFYQTKWGDFEEPIVLKTPGIVHAYDIKIADVNGDRHNDLLVPISYKLNSELGGGLTVYYQDHKTNGLDEIVEFQTQRHTGLVIVEDINHDKKNDVIVFGYVPKIDAYLLTIFLQNKKTRKLEKYKELVYDFNTRFIDIDLDDKTEIVKMNGLEEMEVYTLTGELKGSILFGKAFNYFKVADFDNNGYADALLINVSRREIRLMLQDKNGYKEHIHFKFPQQPEHIDIGDINDDGLLDFVVSLTPEGGQPNWLWKIHAFIQKENTTFKLVDTYETFDRPWGIKIADVMKDGRNDILFLTDGQMYWHNGPSYLHAFFKDNPKKKGILQAIESVTKAGLPEKAKALDVLENKLTTVSTNAEKEALSKIENIAVVEEVKTKASNSFTEISTNNILTLPSEPIEITRNNEKTPKCLDKKEPTAVKSTPKKTETKEQKATDKQAPAKLNIIYFKVLDIKFDRGIRIYKDGSYIKFGDIEFLETFKFYKPWEEKEEDTSQL